MVQSNVSANGSKNVLPKERSLNLFPQRSAGFTIVELLIVIVVIGILAAVTMVAYNGINNRARISALQSNLGQIARFGRLQKFRTPIPIQLP